MPDHMVGFHSPTLNDGGWWNPSALTSSVICPPNVTHVPAETGKVGSGQGCINTRVTARCFAHDMILHVMCKKQNPAQKVLNQVSELSNFVARKYFNYLKMDDCRVAVKNLTVALT